MVPFLGQCYKVVLWFIRHQLPHLCRSWQLHLGVKIMLLIVSKTPFGHLLCGLQGFLCYKINQTKLEKIFRLPKNLTLSLKSDIINIFTNIWPNKINNYKKKKNPCPKTRVGDKTNLTFLDIKWPTEVDMPLNKTQILIWLLLPIEKVRIRFLHKPGPLQWQFILLLVFLSHIHYIFAPSSLMVFSKLVFEKFKHC